MNMGKESNGVAADAASKSLQAERRLKLRRFVEWTGNGPAGSEPTKCRDWVDYLDAAADEAVNCSVVDGFWRSVEISPAAARYLADIVALAVDLGDFVAMEYSKVQEKQDE